MKRQSKRKNNIEKKGSREKKQERENGVQKKWEKGSRGSCLGELNYCGTSVWEENGAYVRVSPEILLLFGLPATLLRPAFV